MRSQNPSRLWALPPLLLLSATLGACSSQSKPLPTPCPTCPLQRPPVVIPQACQAEPIQDPEPPSPDHLPSPPPDWAAAPDGLRAWVQDLTGSVVQYALAQRERGDLLETRLAGACASIEAQQ